MARPALIAGAVCVLLAIAANAELPEVTVGLVYDGPQSRAVIDIDALQVEIDVLLAGEYRLDFADAVIRRADWTLPGAENALRELLEYDDVDVVMTLGILSTQAAADAAVLPRPVIGVAVADPELQGFPIDGDSSGKPNFVYLTNFRSVDTQLAAFAGAVDFERLGVLVDEHTLDALPALSSDKAAELSAAIGAEVAAIPVGDSVDKLFPELDGFDAVYVTPLIRFGESGMRRLAAELERRRLPSFSLLGGSELDWGLLMSLGGSESEVTVLARRIALNIQRIVLGDEPAGIPVAIDYSERLTINMAVAERIGYEPTYAVLADARLINQPEDPGADRIGFSETLVLAVRQNRSLRVAGFDPDVAATDLASARAQLLPQLGVGLSRTQIDEDRANPLVQPERSSDLQLTGRQLLYSDDRIATFRAAGHGLDASYLDYRRAELDVIEAAGVAYLQVLRADALLRVRQANLETTRENLQLARVREAIGFSGRSDVLRWESRLATERRDLIAAEAALMQAGVRLGQVLGESQSAPPQPIADTLDATLSFFGSARFGTLIDSPSSWTRFRSFLVAEALTQSPELDAVDARLAAQQRLRLAARRKFYLPEVELAAGAGNRLSASGAGSDSSLLNQDDESWSVAVTASWPIFTGGALRARLDAEDYRLRQLEAQQTALEEQVEARMRIALHAVGASYSAIDLSEIAAHAARENLTIVADAYAKGAASITDLLEAQDASLTAELGAADARYGYLIDLMAVLRAAGDFRLVLEPDYRDRFLRDAQAYVDAAARGTGDRQ